MLAQEYRLSRKDFLLVKKTGIKLSFPNLKTIHLQNQLSHSRFSIVVSKQYSKSAVARNKFRRSIYNSLDIKHYSLNIDVIVFPFNEKSLSGLNQALSGLATSKPLRV